MREHPVVVEEKYASRTVPFTMYANMISLTHAERDRVVVCCIRSRATSVGPDQQATGDNRWGMTYPERIRSDEGSLVAQLACECLRSC